MHLVDSNGKPVTSTPNTAVIENGFTHYETFSEWCAKSIITTNRAAWEYKEQQLKELAKAFNGAVAAEVLEKNKGIVSTLKEKNQTIEDLKKFTEENIQLIQSLEIKLGELGHTGEVSG